MRRSFLASLALPQSTPSKELTRYDDRRDELLVRRDGAWVPAIDSDEPPRSKKKDIEKGEDLKDRW
jgi:hypothetical protein